MYSNHPFLWICLWDNTRLLYANKRERKHIVAFAFFNCFFFRCNPYLVRAVSMTGIESKPGIETFLNGIKFSLDAMLSSYPCPRAYAAVLVDCIYWLLL